MKWNNYLIIGMLLMGVMMPHAVWSQHYYTLEECKGKALQNNVNIKNARNNLKMAEQEKKEVFTKYFPSVGATGSGFIADKGLIETEVGGKLLSAVDEGMLGGVSASLPLFTGGQILNTNRLADLSVEVSRIRQRQTEKEVLLATENYYWQVVVYKAKLETLRAMEEMVDTLYKDVEASVNAGVTTRNDLLQVQLKRNELKSSHLTLDNALSLSRMVLGQYIGEPMDSVDVADMVDLNRLPENPEVLYCNHRERLYGTDEYRLLEKAVDGSRLQYKKTLGKYLPTVAIGGGYMCDNLMDRSHPFWVGFATVSIPISDWWGGSHALKRKKLEIRNAENHFSDGSERLLIGMQKAWNEVSEAYKQIQIAFQSVEQATENLRLHSDYYKAGTITMNDLLDAQALYQKSKDRYVEACSLYEVRKVTYLQVTGR